MKSKLFIATLILSTIIGLLNISPTSAYSGVVSQSNCSTLQIPFTATDFNPSTSSWIIFKTTSEASTYWGGDTVMLWTSNNQYTTFDGLTMGYNNTTQSATFSIYGGTGVNVYIGAYNSSTSVFSTAGNTSGEGWGSPSTPENGAHNPYVESICNIGGNITYTAPYTEQYPQEPDLISAPEISYQINDDQGTFNAINIPETGVTGVQWLITYGTIEGDPQVQTWEGADIPTKPLNFTFPYIADAGADDKYGTYLISAYYTDENDDQISEESLISVVLRADQYNHFEGTCSGETCLNTGAIGNDAVSLNFDDCTFSADYPWLDITACKNKIGEILGLLNFDKIRYGSQFTGDTTGCHTLTTMGTWLMQPNGTVVCPKISEEVRNTVTPFIMFGLGLVMIQFIAKRGTDQG